MKGLATVFIQFASFQDGFVDLAKSSEYPGEIAVSFYLI